MLYGLALIIMVHGTARTYLLRIWKTTTVVQRAEEGKQHLQKDNEEMKHKGDIFANEETEIQPLSHNGNPNRSNLHGSCLSMDENIGKQKH